MKRFLILLSLLFCNVVFADTINLHWLNEDGSTYQDSTCVIDSDLILPSTPPTKYGYTFTGWKISNYIPIEYLESTGTQYIDTGVFATTIQNIETTFEFSNFIEGSKNRVFGTRTPGNQLIVYNNKFVTQFGKQELSSDITPVINQIYEVKQENNIFYLGNNVLTTHSYTNFTSNNNIILFGLNEGSNKYLGNVKIYNFKISNGSNVVRDFIPVLDENNIPCMFDKVESKFYYNQGTGQFIAGPVLNE